LEKADILNEVSIIFMDILDNDAIVLNYETTANDVDDLDSLNHIQLVVAIEKHFKIRFMSKEIQSWDNVGDMIGSISSKLN
jgi:acyl carrier protein